MPSDAEHPIVAQLPASARASFVRLLDQGVRSPAGLREQLPHYVEAIERASTQGGPPAALGHRIAEGCTALLDAWESQGLDDDGRRLARAAVEYFLLCRDGDDDLATPEGLDDDAAVVDAVRRRLGV